MLNFPKSGSADIRFFCKFFAGDVEFLDAVSDEPGECQSVLRDRRFHLACADSVAFAFAFAGQANPPLLARAHALGRYLYRVSC